MIRLISLIFIFLYNLCPLWLKLKLYSSDMTHEQIMKSIMTCSENILHNLWWLKIKIYSNSNNHKPYIYVCNHIGLLDTFILSLLFKKHKVFNFKGFLDKKYITLPLFGYIMSKSNPLLIQFDKDKTNKDSVNETMTLAKDALNNGTSILIYPEGKMNINPKKLNEIKSGAYWLSKETNVPIKILTIKNAEFLWPSFRMRSFTDIFRSCYMPVNDAVIEIHEHDNEYLFETKESYVMTLESKFNSVLL